MAKSKQEDVQILERGNVYFFYRPKVNVTLAQGLEDVERFYMVLEPKQDTSRSNKKKDGQDKQGDEHLYRLVIIGQKRLPELNPHGRGHRAWAFVEKVTRKAEEIEDEFDPKTYQTKTHGQETREPARPVGEGVYDIVRHGDHTHLAYALNLPRRVGEVQEAFHLNDEGSYIISIKNPNQPAPRGMNFSEAEEAHYPPDIQQKFGEHKWIAVEPVSLLNYSGTQLVLIGAAEDATDELGINLQEQKEQEDLNAIFDDLCLERSQHPTEPLFKGEWK